MKEKFIPNLQFPFLSIFFRLIYPFPLSLFLVMRILKNPGRRDEDRKMSVQEQMLMDQKFLEKLAVVKKEEAERALADFQTWTEKSEMIAGQTMSHVSVLANKDNGKIVDNVSNRPGGLEVLERLTKKYARPKGRQKFKGVLIIHLDNYKFRNSL
jgi:hypothetical protein